MSRDPIYYAKHQDKHSGKISFYSKQSSLQSLADVECRLWPFCAFIYVQIILKMLIFKTHCLCRSTLQNLFVLAVHLLGLFWF